MNTPFVDEELLDESVSYENIDAEQNDNDEFDDEEEYTAEDFFNEMSKAGLAADVKQSLSYYYAVNESPFTAPAQKYFDSEEYADLIADLLEGVESDTSYFVDTFQSVIDVSIEPFTLRQLITNNPIQQQRGLSNASISNFFTRGATAFSKMPILLFNPEVCYLSSGNGIRLIGGNHRVASIIKMLLDSGSSGDFNTVLDTEVRCTTYRVDLQKLSDLMAVGGTRPKQSDVLKQANQIEFALWVGSNGSRTVTSQEVNEALSFARGVNRNDIDSIRDAAFNKDKSRNTASNTDALCWIYRLNMIAAYPTLTSVNNQHYFPVQLPVLGHTSGYILKQTTVDSILRSFMTALKTFKIESAPDAEGKTKKKSRWGLDLSDFSAFCDLIDLLVGVDANQNPMVKAIDAVMSSLPSDSEYSGNIARNASAIGKELAAQVDSSVNPQYLPSFAVAKGKKDKKAPVKRTRRFR